MNAMSPKVLFLIALSHIFVQISDGFLRAGYCTIRVHFRSRVLSRAIPLVLLGSVADDMNWDPKSHPKLDFNEDYYSVLEIDVKASPKELKKAFYKLVTKYHPDNKTGEEAKKLANKQMMVINNAYKVLRESESRVKYDFSRSQGRVGNASKVKSSTQNSQRSSQATDTNSRKTGSSQQWNYKNAVPDDVEPVESLEDILKDLFKDGPKNVGNKIFEDLIEYLENEAEKEPKSSVDDQDYYSRWSASSSSNKDPESAKSVIDEELRRLKEKKWQKSEDREYSNSAERKTSTKSFNKDPFVKNSVVDDELVKLKKKMGL